MNRGFVRSALLALGLASLLCIAGGAHAHGVSYTLSGEEALVVSFYFADGSKFSHQSYEVFRPGEETPFQVGRTDELGRAAFVPDRVGMWRVRVFSEDGHGVDIEVPAEETALSVDVGEESVDGVRAGGISGIFLGISIILAAFGILSLLYGRRRR